MPRHGGSARERRPFRFGHLPWREPLHHGGVTESEGRCLGLPERYSSVQHAQTEVTMARDVFDPLAALRLHGYPPAQRQTGNSAAHVYGRRRGPGPNHLAVINEILWLRFVCPKTVKAGEEQQRETSLADN